MKTKWISIVCGFLLLFGVLNLAYEYYIILRWIVSISSAIIAYRFYKAEMPIWMLIFSGIALIFNPLLPLYLDKSTWVIIDLAISGLFFYNAYLLGSEKTLDNKIVGTDSPPAKRDNIFKRFFSKHEAYFSGVYYSSFAIGYVYAIIILLKTIFDSIRAGDFITFLISIIFSSVFMVLNGLLVDVIVGTLLSIILFIPYLVIRGLKN